MTKNADYYFRLDRYEFFSGDSMSEKEFRQLPWETRNSIIAGKFGMSADEFLALDSTVSADMITAAAGYDYSAGVNAGVSAAQSDSRFSAVKGFLKGAKFTGPVAVAGTLGLLGALVYYKEPIKRKLAQRAD